MKKVFLVSTILTLFFPAVCFSQDPPKSGFKGEVTAGLVFIDSADNLNPKGSKDSLASLDEAPTRQFTIIPVLFPEATFRFGDNNRSAWYFNTTSPIDEAGNFALSTGFNHTLPGIATFEAGVFYVPFTEAWKNPYLINTVREETDVTAWGAQFAANRIVDLPLKLQFVYLSEDVSDDDLAILFPALARDGAVYNLSLGYGFFTESPFSIRPKLSLGKGEYDGDSSSFVKIKAEVSGQYLAGRSFLMPSIHYSYKEYDGKDPVFDSTRRENGYGANLIFKYVGIFDIEALGLLGIAGYGRGAANENFYDTESLFCGLSLTYRL